MNFSVLMSVYKNDRPIYFDRAIESISFSQTLEPDELVLICDGEITEELGAVIEKWKAALQDRLVLIRLEYNRGLAFALNEGLKHCTNDIVARMDADDIALSNRFESQVPYMNLNPDVAVLSSWVEEIDPETEKVLGVRKVPPCDYSIRRMAERRNPINHPVSIFRKSAVLDLGGYPNFRKSQDYALWSLMLNNGCKMANLQKVLLKMRAGDALMSRRGMEYFKHELKLLSFQRKIGFISWYNFIVNCSIRAFFRLAPSSLQLVMYRVLRLIK
ncbi:glycosyltransferase [Agarilytica rhodophyticola]|uniref:glycosyltransferase n=1 Tax=Agarilytica rhodophyticola TaxID=1737490 RepID=UPI000B349A7E|nr:glycosyltransferase [Agarilytica rhodophyticola]